MQCFFGHEIRDIYVCEFCGRVQRGKGFPPWQVNAPCRSDKPRALVGSELAGLFRVLGVTGKSGCGCVILAHKMDARGPSWCRENRALLLNKLRANYALYGWTDKLRAAFAAATSGLAFEMDDWSDPIASLFDLAIQRAESASTQ